MLITLKSNFAELLDGPNITNYYHELAVTIDWPPDEFENRCIRHVSLSDSLIVLHPLGYTLPAKLPDFGALTQSPRMPINEIDRYVARCRQLPDDG